MVEKYIIDKTDIHDLLTGKDLPLTQGKARAFCVEIAGKITNGDMIKAMFPDAEINVSPYSPSVNIYVGGILMMRVDRNYWNAPYKTENKN